MLVKFPSRSRPNLFKRTFRLYRQDETAEFLVSIDADDVSMNNDEMLAWLNGQPRTTVRIGNSRSKVEAVNDGLAEHPWDGILLLASDDMIPQRPDYAAHIESLFGEFFPDGDGVLHLNDGCVGRRLNTICVCDRKYFDRTGYLYAPCYRSTHCDNEWQEVSERLGRAVYVNECVIRHEWIGSGVRDALCQFNESLSVQDGRLFEHRRRLGFPKP